MLFLVFGRRKRSNRRFIQKRRKCLDAFLLLVTVFVVLQSSIDIHIPYRLFVEVLFRIFLLIVAPNQ